MRMITANRNLPLSIPPITVSIIVTEFVLWTIHPILSFGIGCNACIATGEWWRLFTSLFIHYEVQHMMNNCLCLIAIGSILEKRLEKIRFLLIFFLSGICGNLLTYIVMSPNYTHTGVSGSIYGLIGIQLYIFYAERTRYLKEEQFLLVVVLILMVISTFSGGNSIAHLGGLLVGGLLGPFLHKL